MPRFNRFGAIYTQVMSLFPGTALTDYAAGGSAGQANIEGALDRATTETSGKLPATVFRAITKVENEWIERYGTAGETNFNTGIFPIVAGSLHMWIYPLMQPNGGLGNQVGASGFFYLDAYYKPPNKGWLEVAANCLTVNNATGAITYTPTGGASAINTGDRVYATYDVDSDNAAFSVNQLQQIVIMGAAAELGPLLYSESQQDWALVKMYGERYAGFLKDLQESKLIPDEVRKLSHWQEIEPTGREAKNFRINRG